MSESQLIAKARRIAKAHGFTIRKSRAPLSIDNIGEFQLIRAEANIVVAGERFDLTPQNVIEFCEELDEQRAASSRASLGR